MKLVYTNSDGKVVREIPMTNFECITESPKVLAELMKDCADCNNCPVTKSVCKYKYENVKEVTTNFDRITESPERLAKVLAMKALRPCGYELPCNVDCPLNKRCMEDNEPPPTDYEVWLIWLEMDSKE